MSILHSRETQVLIDRIISEGSDLLSTAPDMFQDFVRHYFYSVPFDDMHEREIADLQGSVHAHWELGAVRKPDQSKIRIYNPDPERHGWQSVHTILEIVTHDKPFLVDSVSHLLNRMGLLIHLIIHPVFTVARYKTGKVQGITAISENLKDGVQESYLHFEFDRRVDKQQLNEIKREVEFVLTNIESAYADWSAMRERALECATQIELEHKRNNIDDSDDQAAFCRWMEDGNFAFLGYCELNCVTKNELQLDEQSILGVLHNTDDINTVLPAEGFGCNARDRQLLVSKANARSPIHRPSYMDLITMPKYDGDGRWLGMCVFVGLFASTAYNRSVKYIPLLRNKVNYVVEKSKLPYESYDSRILINIIDNYPRDNLFRIANDELFEDAAKIMELQERQRVTVIIRRDWYGRFCAVLVYLPRDRYNRDLRVRIQDILLDSLQGTSAQFDATFTESVLARINYTIHTTPGLDQKHTNKQIQERVEVATRMWSDHLKTALFQRFGETKRIAFMNKYSAAFATSYQEEFSARTAAADMDRLETLSEYCNTRVFFYRPLTHTGGQVHFKIYNYLNPVSPSDALPVIENMGLRALTERPYQVKPADGTTLWIHDYTLQHSTGLEFDPDDVRAEFEEAFLKIWDGSAENDGFNRMVLIAALTWREVVVLRAYCRYLKQIGSQYSESYMIETLTLHPHTTQRLLALFKCMFDPSLNSRESEVKDHIHFVESGLERVKSLDEDVILRSFLNAITSTLRTNYYRTHSEGQPLPYLSFKIDSARILRMPDPRPMFEIFVYSPRVEAIHLRGGKVARGGLRWSDRREDYRTEVLGLVKAQLVKNAVIVPVGSKGGFIVKQPPADRKALSQEVIECYRTFIRGMLDITDNLVAGKIVHPQDVTIYDDDDPYFVVAADKGTATFSDIANDLSHEYGFWLGDAFASGGSAGYDHKGMGITARGAWESVKRSFRELGKDIQSSDFTVVGIGDMGGDVFGNGMLLSRRIKLVGAFNHLHILIDPGPDPEKSFVERERLFQSSGLTWKDYNQKLISKGGGVYDRSAKAIKLQPQAQEALGISDSSLTPNELINAMLKAPVDLLWNGGIGTYVKASTETHDDAADRTNDSVRVNGSELRCRVIGEGGNLGFTQLGRIEFSLNGGKCFTDFIDNSGGVDCSDHEVNIKILLDDVVNSGDMTGKQRNKLLEEMTDTVSEYVIADNYQQTQAICLTALNSVDSLEEHTRFIRELERAGELNRELEFLPDSESLEERANDGNGLTQPEISVLLAYAKMTLYQKLLDSDFPEDLYLRNDLKQYFPQVLVNRFEESMFNHRLKREIIATYATNNMVNRVGPTFAFRIRQLTSADFPDIARAYTVVREIFGMQEFWEEIEMLDNKVDARTQMNMLLFANGLIERGTMWILRHCVLPVDIHKTVDLYRTGVKELAESLPTPLSKNDQKTMELQTKEFVAHKVPKDLAKKVAGFIPLSAAMDVVNIANDTSKSVSYAGGVYFEVGTHLNLMWIRDQIATLNVSNLWHQIAKSRLRDEIHGQQYEITRDIVEKKDMGNPHDVVVDWIKSKTLAFRRLSELIEELKVSGSSDFASLSVAISEVQSLRRQATASAIEFDASAD